MKVNRINLMCSGFNNDRMVEPGCRIWSCIAIVERRQSVLCYLRICRNSFDADLVYSSCWASHVCDVITSGITDEWTGPSLSHCVHPIRSHSHHFLFHTSLGLFDTVCCVHHYRTGMELSRFILLLFHIDDNHWTRWLHSRRQTTSV